MSYVPTEPEAIAVTRLAEMLESARLVQRRTIHNERLGITYESEIAWPGETGYGSAGSGPGGAGNLGGTLPVEDPGMGEQGAPPLFGFVVKHSTRDALTRTDRLPGAWVFAAEQALVEGVGPGHAGDQRAALEIGVHVKDADPKEEPDRAAILKNRIADLVRRIRLERLHELTPGDQGAQRQAGRWSTTYSADGRHLHHDLPIALVFRDKQA